MGKAIESPATAWSQALDFSGKTALVVGGATGIGLGIAQALRNCGARVHVWGSRARAPGLAAESDEDLSQLEYRQVDVTDTALVERLTPEFARLDVLVLSQGLVLYGRQEFDPVGFARVLDVNLTSVMRCAVRFHEMLRASRGALVVISSIGAFSATVGNPAYSASKAGTVGLVRTLGKAWVADGIRVNAVAPGMVATRMTAVTTRHPRRLQEATARVPAGRLGTVQDIAGAALFLASPLANYICGQTLIVDGGTLLF